MSQQALREARALEAATCLDVDVVPLPNPPGLKRRRRKALPYLIVLGVALVAAAISGVVVLMFVNVPSQSLVVASVPYWNMDYGTASVLSSSNANTFSEMSPWMYELNTSGQIVPQYPASQAPAIEAQLAQLREAHVPIVPTIANVINGQWIYQPVMTDILYNSAVRARHVAAIVALVQQQD
jgi:spore germination protein